MEIAGSIKNVIAIAAGICDGIGYGDNTKAALLTRGISEITRLGEAMGAEVSTFRCVILYHEPDGKEFLMKFSKKFFDWCLLGDGYATGLLLANIVDVYNCTNSENIV